ncbi:MAG TPA: hypothetical protein DD670_03935, partial [Planctomycetaceae bacterium]|nr:hypothetical protein [Planctomycetaceae bacterium]
MAGSAQPMIGSSVPPMTGSSSQPMIGGSPQPVIGGSVPGPAPTYGGTVLPPPGTWDPYAPPGAGQSPTLLPKDYYPTLPGAPDENRLQRLLDEIRLDYHLFSSRGSNGFGINDLDLSVTFAFPMFHNTETPLLITPGFACHWWEGPAGAPPGSLFADLPPRVYDAYLGAAWNPQITPVVGGELAFRVGVYSDFHKVTSDSIRYTGHGLLTLALSPSFKLKGGIVYYDRVRIKMLPAAGVIWTPN